MSDEITTPEDGVVEGQEPEVTSEQTGAKDEGTEEVSESVEEKLARVEAELAETRNEAAKRRTQLREAQEALANAKTAEDVARITEEFESKIKQYELDLAKERVARQFGLPDALAARLQGTSEEELKADAEALKEFATPKVENPRTPGTPGGGRNPGGAGNEDTFDKDAYLKHLRKQRGF